jgi:GNAT superfamily N-acetyltransferase
MREGTMDTILLRQVTSEADTENVVEMAGRIWREHFVPIIGSAQVEYMLEKFQSPAAIAQQIAEGYQYYLVVIPGGAVGYFALVAREQELFLSKIYLERSQRGKGYARQIIDFVVACAVSRRLPRIGLTVNRKNSGAIAAYQRMGFSLVRALAADIGDGFVMDDYVMHRPVALPEK